MTKKLAIRTIHTGDYIYYLIIERNEICIAESQEVTRIRRRSVQKLKKLKKNIKKGKAKVV